MAGMRTDGVVLQETGVIGAREGLKIGDVVVAIDAVRV